jgi:hypothetical protein
MLNGIAFTGFLPNQHLWRFGNLAVRAQTKSEAAAEMIVFKNEIEFVFGLSKH